MAAEGKGIITLASETQDLCSEKKRCTEKEEDQKNCSVQDMNWKHLEFPVHFLKHLP